MPSYGAPQGLKPSLLDRLIDPEARGTAWRAGYGEEQMQVAVQRDLEDLLNTRRTLLEKPDAYPEVATSVFAYGLPDLTSFDASTRPGREQIGTLLESIVRAFEPRLREVRATLLDPAEGSDRTLRFRIDAQLNVEPAPDVAFETILELTTGHHSVRPAGA